MILKKELNVGLQKIPVYKLILAAIAIIIGVAISRIAPPPELDQHAMN